MGPSSIISPDSGTEYAVLTIVPSHNEERVIGDCLESIRRAYHGSPRCSTLVIVDNCSDRTEAIARAAGAEVLVRKCPERPGKGSAIEWAQQRIDLARFDAFAFVDADTLVDPDFYRAMDSELRFGHRVLQGYLSIANPGESPLTRLITITNTMKNLLFNHGKSLLGLSPLLMGNGMVLTRDVLLSHPWSSYSIVENLEQSLKLIERGERIVFVPDARVYAQEAATLGVAYHQRQRWASGQAALFGAALRTVWRGFRDRNLPSVDAGLELLLPVRYSRLMNLSLVNLMFACAYLELNFWLGCVVALPIALQLGEFGIGIMLAHPPGVLSGLALAGPFLVWKAAIDLLALGGFRRRLWHRTKHSALQKSSSTNISHRAPPR